MSSKPYQQLRAEVRSRGRAFGKAIACLIDHAAAIGTYEQKLTTESDAEIREIMARAQSDEFRHFANDLEYLLKAQPEWRTAIDDVIAETRPAIARSPAP
jgi:hypothetical protein